MEKSNTRTLRSIVIILYACLLLFTSCSFWGDKNNLEQSDFSFLREGFSYDEYKLELSDFIFLRDGISYDEIVSEVGPPDEEIGSGLHIFLYSLDDGRTLALSFASLDHLMSVSIGDKEGVWEELELPIGPGE